MPRKNKPRNPLSFRVNADLRAKCKKQKRDAKYPAIYLLFFAFRTHFCIFRDKCIASLIGKPKLYVEQVVRLACFVVLSHNMDKLSASVSIFAILICIPIKQWEKYIHFRAERC